MDRRLIAVALVAVMAMIVVAPALSEESSAMTEKNGRLSRVYISSAETVVPANFIMSSNELYMIHGSDNQLAMEAYISDPQNSAPITGDDRDLIDKSGEGTPIDIYVLRSYDFAKSTNIPVHVDLTPRLAPYDIDIDAEAGDIVKIRIVEAGGNLSGYINVIQFAKDGPNPSTSGCSVGYTYTTEMKEGESLSMTLAWMQSGDIYVDVKYDIDVSTPNGSATLFAAACIVVAALAMMLIVIAALKPGWAK